MIGNLIEEIIEAWHERPIRVIFAFLLIETLLVIVTIVGGELITTYVVGAIILILFVGGLLLSFSVEPRKYDSATWMSVVAFFLLLNSMESIKDLGISFLSATSMLTWTAVAFILLAFFLAIFEKNDVAKIYVTIFRKDEVAKIYVFATLAFAYVLLRAFSH